MWATTPPSKKDFGRETSPKTGEDLYDYPAGDPFSFQSHLGY